MDLYNDDIKLKINETIVLPTINNNLSEIGDSILLIYNKLYASIPDKKRISYGTYYIIRTLGAQIYSCFDNDDIVITLADNILTIDEYLVKGIALYLISYCGLNNPDTVLPYFKKYATDDNWIVREFAAGFIQKLVKKYPDKLKEFYLKLVKSKDANIRRFVSESLRPVSENKWFYNNPEYSLSIIKYLYKEKAAYPRSSVGNHLSDYARRLPDMVYEIVEKLVKSGDKNSYWIAYRACRNLVKKEPIKVMDILKIDEYKYKTRIHRRSDY